ncbi:MAG: hypothetical protein M1290_00315 [Candidatus Thermoplasmatota archaeon]|jgi:hypothetical protein|nr:hypothetical protein [Candidatus Thermoplasmatota archaeon]MCL5788894.1 hypothetical protein [Candidatus Thermoplasmatota archaeon]
MKEATKEDADLLLKLMQITDTPQMAESMNWFMNEFSARDYKDYRKKCPAGSIGENHVSRILSSFELAGVLVSHGVLNENLYFDMSGIGFIWPKLENIVTGMRKEMDESLWENAVWLANRQKQWKKEVWRPNLAWKFGKVDRASSKKE